MNTFNEWNTPKIQYYAKLLNSTENGKKTPKYTIIGEAGYYPPMEQLRGRDNKISMNLMEKLKEGNDVPSMRLQAKNSLNFTGLKEYFEDGCLSGVAYGYPDDRPTYSSKNKPNPFYDYREDGYLFLIHQDENNPQNLTPVYIELMVISGARYMISAFCKMLKNGGFDEALTSVRKLASVL